MPRLLKYVRWWGEQADEAKEPVKTPVSFAAKMVQSEMRLVSDQILPFFETGIHQIPIRDLLPDSRLFVRSPHDSEVDLLATQMRAMGYLQIITLLFNAY